MMHRAYYITSWAFILLVILLVLGCQNESEEKDFPIVNTDLLVGKWTLIEANRNGQATTTLTDAYFEFHGLDSISTNLPTGDQKYEAVVKDSIFGPSDSSILYRVVHLSEDSLSVNFSVERWRFDLKFIKNSNDLLQ